MVLKNISKRYEKNGDEDAGLKDISLSIEKGEMIAITGASGSGKSTLLYLLGLLEKPDSGEYYFDGKKTGHFLEEEQAHFRNHHLGFVFQHFYLMPQFTVAENIALPFLYRKKSSSFLQEDIKAVLNIVGLNGFEERYPATLSGGEKQRIAIARALIGKPSVILADEPTGALDTATGNIIFSLFERLHENKTTLIIVTHDLTLAARCPRQLTLLDGRLL